MNKRALLTALGSAIAVQANDHYKFSKLDRHDTPIILSESGFDHNSLHQTKRQRKIRKNRRRIANKMRAYNRRAS